VRGDGDGWVECGQGHRHWGRLGAAGLLLRTVDDTGTVRVLAQHRAAWTHDGGTWGIVGGARDSHEDETEAALREAAEEAGLAGAVIRVRDTSRDDHGGWSYTTVVADVAQPVDVVPNAESEELRWVPEHELDELPLHPGFETTWPSLRAVGATLVVDGANVVGSRPDGWWRDRAGAARLLQAQLESLRSRVARGPEGERIVVRRVLLVLEGAARSGRPSGDDRRWIDVVEAPGEGDDTIVEVARELAAARDGGVIVVTADRGLRARLPATTSAAGPGWLLALLG
jgi:8-oxo-dGTP diphosphatase